MATHVAIEVAPAAFRVIEIEGGVPWIRRVPSTEVLSFDILQRNDPSTPAKLERLRKRSVAAVVWGVPSEHRQVVVGNGSYEAMRREALDALAGAGIETRGVLADIAPATRRNDRSPRRPVVAALAAAAQMTEALTPLTNAGIRVRSLLTPAAALTSLARTRRTLAVPDSIEAYVALDERATCIALVRNGALLTARELSWGYLTSIRFGELPHLDHLAARLAGELSEFFGAIGAATSEASQVCVCGGLPDLRSMTARLTETLDVEVEPLDSLFGLDPDALSDRADEFRERAAEMRVAWAAATDWPPTINLLRPRRRQIGKAVLARAAIVAGAAAGLAVGWQIQRSSWLRSSSPPVARTAAKGNPPARSTSPVAATARPAAPPVTTTTPPTAAPAPSPVAPKPLPPAAPTVVATKPSPPPPAASTVVATKPSPPPPAASTVVATKPSPPPPAASTVVATKPSTPPTVAATKPPTPPAVVVPKPPPAPAIVATKPVLPAAPTATAMKPATPAPADVKAGPLPPAAAAAPRPSAPAPAPQQIVGAKPAASALPQPNATTAARRDPERVPASQPPSRSQPAAPRQRTPTAAPTPMAREEPLSTEPPARRQPTVRTPPPETALPFEASLGTILYSPDRKLAIVDGRIIGVGDEVRGARVTDITANAVFLRDAQGKLRRLTLAGSR